MTAGLDTAVVIRLITGLPADQSAEAWRFIGEQTAGPSGPPNVSDLVIMETYFALTHHYGMSHAAALDGLHRLMSDPRVHAFGVAPQVVEKARATGTKVGLADRLIHADYAQHGAQLATFDRAAGTLANSILLDA